MIRVELTPTDPLKLGLVLGSPDTCGDYRRIVMLCHLVIDGAELLIIPVIVMGRSRLRIVGTRIRRTPPKHLYIWI